MSKGAPTAPWSGPSPLVWLRLCRVLELQANFIRDFSDPPAAVDPMITDEVSFPGWGMGPTVADHKAEQAEQETRKMREEWEEKRRTAMVDIEKKIVELRNAVPMEFSLSR